MYQNLLAKMELQTSNSKLPCSVPALLIKNCLHSLQQTRYFQIDTLLIPGYLCGMEKFLTDLFAEPKLR